MTRIHGSAVFLLEVLDLGGGVRARRYLVLATVASLCGGMVGAGRATAVTVVTPAACTGSALVYARVGGPQELLGNYVCGTGSVDATGIPDPEINLCPLSPGSIVSVDMTETSSIPGDPVRHTTWIFDNRGGYGQLTIKEAGAVVAVGVFATVGSGSDIPASCSREFQDATIVLTTTRQATRLPDVFKCHATGPVGAPVLYDSQFHTFQRHFHGSGQCRSASGTSWSLTYAGGTDYGSTKACGSYYASLTLASSGQPTVMMDQAWEVIPPPSLAAPLHRMPLTLVQNSGDISSAAESGVGLLQTTMDPCTARAYGLTFDWVFVVI